MPMKWHGERVIGGIKAELEQRIRKAAYMIEAETKRSMKKGGRTESGETVKETYTTRTGRARSRMLDPSTGARAGRTGSYRSKPGEPPRVQTGTLRRSITTDFTDLKTKMEARVGTNMVYGKFLEFGTRRMMPRPFLRPAAHRMERPIRALFARPIRKIPGVPG